MTGELNQLEISASPRFSEVLRLQGTPDALLQDSVPVHGEF
jgi:hypothetical protein